MKLRACSGLLLPAAALFEMGVRGADLQTNAFPSLQQPSGDLLFVMLKLIGALFLVIAVFLLGVWFFKRSRWFSLYQGAPAQLKILESRSLGYRNTLFVVGYSHHRFLLAASTTGVSLVSPLPDASPTGEVSPSAPSFAEQLHAVQRPPA